jgi:hypothetical protein
MSETKDEGRAAILAPMTIRQLLGAGFIGLLIGLIVWGIGSAVNQYVLQVFFCPDAACTETTPYALAIGSVVGAALGLFGLIKQRVLRPLLVAAAGMAALWNVPPLLEELPVYGVIIAMALLYAGMYALFAWLARLRSIYVVLVLFVILIVAVRLVLTA